MNLKNLMLNERSLTQKSMYHIISFKWSSRVGKSNIKQSEQWLLLGAYADQKKGTENILGWGRQILIWAYVSHSYAYAYVCVCIHSYVGMSKHTELYT